MKFRPAIRSVSHAMLAAVLCSVACIAQTTSTPKPTDTPPCPPPSQTTGKPATDKPCVPPADQKQAPPAAQQFPFPGEPAKPLPSSDTSDAPTPAKPHSTAADEHPFPTQTPPPMYDTDSSSSSSSSSSSNDSSPSDGSSAGPDATSKPAPWADSAASTRTRRKLPKVQNLQTDDERVTEDLTVAKFYEDRGDLNAAYQRAKDAVKIEPKDAESHYVLAHLAQKLQKRDEAIAEFNNYLKIEPDGDKVKQARKALTQLR